MMMNKINPKVARPWDDYYSSIPLDYLEKNEDIYGSLTKPSLINPVSNTDFDFLFFNDSSVFSPAAKFFESTRNSRFGSTYTTSYPGSKDYKKFWQEEKERCLKGYEPIIDGVPCGVRIPGEYYFYLNYCVIGKSVKDENTGEDTERLGFPNFCSMDYYWFKVMEECENPSNGDKKNLIAAKARRKGFSYKNAAGAVWKYSFFKESKVVIAAELGQKAKQTFDMCLNMIDFLNRYTEFRSPWTNRKSSENKCYIRAGVEVEKDGRKFIKGRKSIIETISLHNKPDAAAGLGATRILFEEAGQIKDLKKAWRFTEPTLRSGKKLKGIAIVYGTGGDMDGATQDFADMFSDPEPYGFKAFKNIYEDNDGNNKCGWFIDNMWFHEGCSVNIDGTVYEALDKNGNPRKWVAELDMNKDRMIAYKGDKESYNTIITQYCKTPSEAFLVSNSSIFPAAEIFERIQRLKLLKNKRFLGSTGDLVSDGKEIVFRPLDKVALDHYPLKDNIKDREGAIVQYEPPIPVNGEILEDSYIISIDPIKEDSEFGKSLIAIYVFKTKMHAHVIGHDEIVMSYIGRPKYDPINSANEILLKMSLYYNAKITHENDVNASAIRNFFISKGMYSKLMQPPGDIVDKFITDAKTNYRKTGHSMGNAKLKQIAEQYTERWLMEKRSFNDTENRYEINLDKIYDLGLLQELYRYNRNDNFDRVSALFGIILQQEQLIHSVSKRETKSTEALPSSFFIEKYKNLLSRTL